MGLYEHSKLSEEQGGSFDIIFGLDLKAEDMHEGQLWAQSGSREDGSKKTLSETDGFL